MLSPLLLAAAMLFPAQVRADEHVILFPTCARFDSRRQTWVGEVHGWIFEPEEDSEWRSEVIESLEEAAKLDLIEWDRDLLKSRALPFLADNEGGKRVDVRIPGVVVRCDRSAANGHFFGKFSIPKDNVPADTHEVEAEVELRRTDDRKFTGQVYLIPSEGVSIISDIDDTIKQSNVLDKVELLRNTFARPFVAVEGMPQVYQALAERGATFHYVSASPWQLYAPLEQFVRLEKYPPGTWDMKSFRIWDDSWRNLLANSAKVKTPAIERLLRQFPERRFLLIGDSGEADPEIYGKLARKYPAQVLGIAIRGVRNGESLEDARFGTALEGIEDKRALLFTDPQELTRRVDAWWPR